MLKLLAYFDNQCLWYELFHAGLSDSSRERLREVVTNDVVSNGVMGILAEYCFLEVQQKSESWSMHNCMHDWTLAALNKDIDAKHYWYAFDCISPSVDDGKADDFANRSYCPLAALATRLVQQRFCQNDGIRNFAPHQLDQASLIASLLLPNTSSGSGADVSVDASWVRESARSKSHFDPQDCQQPRESISAQGKLDQAERMYQRALAGYEEALGMDHMSTLYTVYNIRLLYQDRGKMYHAKQMYQCTLSGK